MSYHQSYPQDLWITARAPAARGVEGISGLIPGRRRRRFDGEIVSDDGRPCACWAARAVDIHANLAAVRGRDRGD